MSILATKTYKPDSVSIANWDVSSFTADELANYWRWGESLKIEGANFADQIPARKALREGRFSVVAYKRRGYLLLEAHAA